MQLRRVSLLVDIGLILIILFTYSVLASAQISKNTSDEKLFRITRDIISVRDFSGRVLMRRHGSIVQVGSASVREFVPGGDKPLAETTTASDGTFKLPTPKDAGTRVIIVTDNTGRLSLVHVRLSQKGGRINIWLPASVQN